MGDEWEFVDEVFLKVKEVEWLDGSERVDLDMENGRWEELCSDKGVVEEWVILNVGNERMRNRVRSVVMFGIDFEELR